ncbi:hypothetical protein D0Z07_5347 [Hyphodiscus hymeniophilus]|uniref:Trichothecene 3-O-acetyltransferase-like N-terminal domain-containing protein n=1 Tax=Hyphodiscus hymeniophilus TaxID=353542 RepID=A0A9P6VIQ2_9HELO|nr:hypothetical protein D0Z07_5347 [Hyphodiscus hymeniophilus]
MAVASSFDESVLISGPSFHIGLAGLDARHPVHYSRRLLIFRCDSSRQRDAQLAALKSGLQAVVLRCPALGGLVVPSPSIVASNGKKDWRIIVPGDGIELVVRDHRTAIPSLKELEAANFPGSRLPYDLLVPIPHDLDNVRPFAASKVQFTAIEGGTILTWAMTQSFSDGQGTNDLIRILSEETKFAQEHQNEARSMTITPMVGLDRSVLRNIMSETPFNIKDHPAYKSDASTSPTPQSDQKSHPFEATSPEIGVTLCISPANLARLKADATLLDAPPISTHDALSALIWRTVLLIRSRRSPSKDALPVSATGSLFMPTDARHHLHLPSSYIGNTVYQLHAKLELNTLFSPSGFKYAASAVRSAIKAINPAIVKSLMAETNERWIDWAFIEVYSTTGVGMRTDWKGGKLYSQDWGKVFGPVIRARYPGSEGEAGNGVMPKLPDGGAEVDVAVMPTEVEFLKSEDGFGRYLN